MHVTPSKLVIGDLVLSLLLLLSTLSELPDISWRTPELGDVVRHPLSTALILLLPALVVGLIGAIILRRRWAPWFALTIVLMAFGRAVSEGFRDRDAIDGMFSSLLELGSLCYLAARLATDRARHDGVT